MQITHNPVTCSKTNHFCSIIAHCLLVSPSTSELTEKYSPQMIVVTVDNVLCANSEVTKVAIQGLGVNDQFQLLTVMNVLYLLVLHCCQNLFLVCCRLGLIPWHPLLQLFQKRSLATRLPTDSTFTTTQILTIKHFVCKSQDLSC